MNDKFQNKYRIPTNRLSGFDYGSNAFYFVTICTKDRLHYFGEIIHNVETDNNLTRNNVTHNNDTHNNLTQNNVTHNNDTHNGAYLRMTEIGKIAHEYWMDIPNHYPFVILDEFVVMPNHIHGIIFFNKEDYNEWNPNQFGKQSGNLGAIIRAYKASVKRHANQHNIDFHWQSRYHDRIIRDEREYNAVKNYIINNPINWVNDELFSTQ